MSTVIDNARLTSPASIAGLMPISSMVDVVGEIPFVLPSAQTDLFLKLFISDFNSEFHLPLVDIDFSREQSVCELKVALVDDAFLVIRLNGELDENKDTFRIKQVNISHELTDNRALPKFVALTFKAMLTLASAVTLKMPEIGLNLTTTFEFPLKELSHVLQIRQLAYRVMVIEKALKTELIMPSDYSGEDIEGIAYSYHSIVERSFDWEHVPTQYPVPAIREVLDWFPKSKEVPLYEFAPSQVSISIFGKDIYLGHHRASIENAVIENYEEAKKELSKLDGHIVNVLVRSLNGLIRVEVIDTPRLPEKPWEPRIQQLIDLSPQLSGELARRYCELAAATLRGLTEEEKNAVTARTEIDEEAFSIEE